jgi:protein-S-isoprenylcysteine O-methyltransferase Ste14
MEIKPTFEPGILNAWIFMSVFIIQMVVMMLADEQVRKRSHVPGEAKRDKSEKYISILANLVWLLTLVYSVFLPFKTGTMWFYAGIFVFSLGLIMLAIATYNFITTRSDLLITKGVYKISRHPMYLATLFICLGSGIASGSLIFIFLSLIMAFCFHKEALVEEKYCLKQYGNSYLQYISNVSRWFSLPSKV